MDDTVSTSTATAEQGQSATSVAIRNNIAFANKRRQDACEASYLSDLGEHVLHSPDLALAAKTVLTAELELLVESLLLKGTSDRSVGLAV